MWRLNSKSRREEGVALEDVSVIKLKGVGETELATGIIQYPFIIQFSAS